MKRGDLIEYSVEKRSRNVVGIQGKELPKEEAERILKERSQKGAVPRPRRGLCYAHALSAMQGAGYEEDENGGK